MINDKPLIAGTDNTIFGEFCCCLDTLNQATKKLNWGKKLLWIVRKLFKLQELLKIPKKHRQNVYNESEEALHRVLLLCLKAIKKWIMWINVES